MHDTITLPKTMFDRIERVMRRLVAKVEPVDTEAKAVRQEAVALIEDVTQLADTTIAPAKKSGAQVLLDLAKKAEREGWSGLSDLAENHDTYAAEAAAADLKRIHDDNR